VCVWLCTVWWCLTCSRRMFPGTFGAVVGGGNVSSLASLSAVLTQYGVYAWPRTTLILLLPRGNTTSLYHCLRVLTLCAVYSQRCHNGRAVGRVGAPLRRLCDPRRAVKELVGHTLPVSSSLHAVPMGQKRCRSGWRLFPRDRVAPELFR
jgi:hypothetical protein